ncbi:RNA polymerase II [Pyronema omphalodes]|nr:RNA polymerase II [Pyronema omphalodes]
MKVLNPMVGMLSNYEVLAHITAMKTRYTKEGQMKSSNLETVMKEVREYLLHTPAGSQTPADIDRFLESLTPYDLEKAEILQMLNERPVTAAELDCVVEELEARFSAEDIESMLTVVKGLPKPKVAVVV